MSTLAKETLADILGEALAPRPKHWNSALDQDETLALFTRKLRSQEPFIWVRFGDADIDWMAGRMGHTCDGEQCIDGLGAALRSAWDILTALPNFYLGDMETFGTPASEFTRAAYREFIAHAEEANDLPIQFTHYEANLIHRKSVYLLVFYMVLRDDPRRKVLIAPERVSRGAKMLDADFYSIHETEANRSCQQIANVLAGMDWDIALFCAGRMSKVVIAQLAYLFPERTMIELGSGLDPLFVGKTRSEQLRMSDARDFFKELL